MIERSTRIEVRNPILALPGFRAIQSRLSDEARAALADICKAIQADARLRSDKCWRTHKAPMAVYWKAVSVYAGHIARAVRAA